MSWREHQIWNEHYNLDADLKPEINRFKDYNKISWYENRALNKILDYNIKHNKEKLVLQNTTKKELLNLLWIRWLSTIVKRKINHILKLSKRVHRRERVKKYNDKYIIPNPEKSLNKLLSSKKYNFIEKLLTSKTTRRNERIIEFIKKIKVWGKDLAIFQSYAREKWWYNYSIDWKFWRKTESALVKFLKNKYWITEEYLEKWKIIDEYRKFRLDSTIWEHNPRYKNKFWEWGEFEGLNERWIRKMIDYALWLTKKWKKGIIWAKHCTDWVSKVWAKTGFVWNADSWKEVWNGWHWDRINYAPKWVYKAIKPGDYVVIRHPNWWTHWVIALWPVDSRWYLPTVSYPNGGRPPRRHNYYVWKHHIIRVKRPIPIS